jgi:hypothetical protein
MGYYKYSDHFVHYFSDVCFTVIVTGIVTACWHLGLGQKYRLSIADDNREEGLGETSF